MASFASRERTLGAIGAFVAGLAVLLTGLGVRNRSHGVAQRRQEIGVRIALGAVPAAVIWLVLQRVGLLVAGGLVAGIVFSLWGSRMARALLYGVAPWDVGVSTTAAGGLLLAALLASWRPAHRAARLDPVAALRQD